MSSIPVSQVPNMWKVNFFLEIGAQTFQGAHYYLDFPLCAQNIQGNTFFLIQTVIMQKSLFHLLMSRPQ